jgi:hypothetical protein
MNPFFACFRLLVIASFLASCGSAHSDAPAPPAVDVTGVWHGTWTGPADQGYALIELHQQPDGAVTGATYVRYDLPATTNVATDVVGRTEGTTVSFTMQSSANPNVFRATVTGDAASGTVDFRGNQGAWQAERIPTRQLVSQTSFAVDIPAGLRSMTMAEGDLVVLWHLSYQSGIQDCEPDHTAFSGTFHADDSVPERDCI